jgi:hypothetical protein
MYNLKLAQSTVSNDVALTGLAGDILPFNHLFQADDHTWSAQSRNSSVLDGL